MERHEYLTEIKKIGLHKDFRGVRLPESVFNFGWEIAKLKPTSWIVERVRFWLFAYDRQHKWVNQDFLFEVNELAYRKARQNKREKLKNRAKSQEIHRPLLPPLKQNESSWADCSGSLDRTLKRMGFSSLHEAVFGTKDSKRN